MREESANHDAPIILNGEIHHATLEGIVRFAPECAIDGAIGFESHQSRKIFPIQLANQSRDKNLPVLLQVQRRLAVTTMRFERIGKARINAPVLVETFQPAMNAAVRRSLARGEQCAAIRQTP